MASPSVLPAVAVVAPGSAEAHVRHLDLAGVGGHVVDSADHVGVEPDPERVEHLDSPYPRPGSDSHDPGRVVERADRAGHVRPMTVLVVAVQPEQRAVGLLEHVQVRVVEADAGVDHGDVDVHPLVGLVDVGGRA
jgi:hypothetical protein